MISKESCDPEDWNACWKFSFGIKGIKYIIIYIQIENVIYTVAYFTILMFFCNFDQINAALVSIRNFFQKSAGSVN